MAERRATNDLNWTFGMEPQGTGAIMNLIEHAQHELKLAGIGDSDADYGGAISNSVMRLIQTFADDQHSGGSAGVTLAIFDKLARFQTLSPITDSPEEWTEVSDGLWQNKRQGSAFSRDGGSTWYDIDDPSRNNGDTWKRDPS